MGSASCYHHRQPGRANWGIPVKSSSEYSILAGFDREMTYLSPNEFKKFLPKEYEDREARGFRNDFPPNRGLAMVRAARSLNIGENLFDAESDVVPALRKAVRDVVEAAVTEDITERARYMESGVTDQDLGRLAAAVLNSAVERRSEQPDSALLELASADHEGKQLVRILRRPLNIEEPPFYMLFSKDRNSGLWLLSPTNTRDSY